jgi:hypothetical protein
MGKVLKAIMILAIAFVLVGYAFALYSVSNDIQTRATMLQNDLAAYELRKNQLTQQQTALEAAHKELTALIVAEKLKAAQDAYAAKSAAEKQAMLTKLEQQRQQQIAAQQAAAQATLLEQQRQQQIAAQLVAQPSRPTTRAS